LGPLDTAATNRPIVPTPFDYEDGEIGGMIGRGNRSTRRKSAPVPPCSPQTPHAVRTRTRAAAVGSQRLTVRATARPYIRSKNENYVVFLWGGGWFIEFSCVTSIELCTHDTWTYAVSGIQTSISRVQWKQRLYVRHTLRSCSCETLVFRWTEK
jgi:hypothetical protein